MVNLKYKCPVCSEEISLKGTACCSNCGWQTIALSSLISQEDFSRYTKLISIKKKAIEYHAKLSKQADKSKLTLQKLNIDIDIQKKGLHELSNQNYRLKLQLKKTQESLETLDNTQISGEVNKLSQQLEDLEAKLFRGDEDYHKAAISLKCKYNAIENRVEVTVENVENRFDHLKQELLFGVAFSLNPIYTLHDTDIIIPTDSKAIRYLEEGENYFFHLKMSPPKKYIQNGHYNIVHLVYDTLTKFEIK